MKKLLFAIAGAASFAALAADPAARTGDISLVGFENYTADQTVIGYRDDGQQGQGGESPWSATGDDASVVKTYGGENAAVPTGISFPAPFEDAGDKYLDLNTEGAELRRAIPAAGQAIAADGTYIDTLVQFTPSESAPTETDLNGAKLAIWLSSENNVTNLCVAGGFYEGAELDEGIPTGAPSVSPKTYKLSGTYDPSTWYRLTVKAIKFVEASGSVYVGFQISIDGTPLTTDTAAYDSNAMVAFGFLNAETSLLTGNLLVPSAYAALDDNTLTSVGFKGTGALDDFVVTTVAPSFEPAPIDFTLTWPSGLTAVSYTLDGVDGEAVTIANGSATIRGTNGAPVTLTGSLGYANKTVTGNIAANGTLALGAVDISFYFPLTATPDQDGTAVHPYEIADETGLNAFKAATAAGFGKTLAYQLTADVALTAGWPGIGTYDNQTNADAFEGIFDGAGHRISNVLFADNETGGNAASTANNYRGFFNQVNGATIKNLTIQWNGWVPNVSTTEFGGAAIVGCANDATLECLTAEGTVTAGTHNNAGIAVRACGLTAPTTFSNCTNKMALTGNYTKLGGMCAITQSGTSTVTFDGCVNEGSITAVAVTGATNAGRDGVAGILGYAANGDGNTIINACVNTGTIDVSAGYSGTHSGYTGAKAGQLLGWAYNSASLTGANTVGTGFVAVGAYSANKTSGQNFATVSGTTATMIADADVVPGQTQYMAMTEKAAYQFAAAGTLIVDEALKAATVTVADESLTLTSATVGTVTTYTVAAAGGDDYVVEIEGSDVVITPQAGDLEALAEAGVDTNSVAAVNAALATTIEGTSIPAWQALFLGVAPTTNGLETVAIKSISIAADGTVTVEMADGVTLKTGRGVDIKLKLMGSTDLSTWTQIGSDITNTKVIPAITPAQGETKKCYKVVVDFAGSSAQN